MSENLIKWSVSGMSCQGCARSVSTIISRMASIEKEAVKIDLDAGTAQFSAPENAPLNEIARKLADAGYPVER